MALHTRFIDAFRRLMGSWSRYQDTPRDPEKVRELGAARADLEDARSEADEARKEHHPEWQRQDAPERKTSRTSASDEEIAKLRLRGDSFGHRG